MKFSIKSLEKFLIRKWCQKSGMEDGNESNARITDFLFNKASGRKIPLNGTFELSPECNFACRMCYVRKTRREILTHDRPMVTLEQWLEIARQARAQGLLYLLLTGGEPFLWPDFWKLYDALMLVSDSAGLGIFTVYGARVAIGAGYEENLFLVLFVAVITGVGGGVMRDLFAGDRPYIFVKHVYACAALLGAIAFAALKPLVGLDGATIIGFALIVVIRFCSAHFHWSLPKAHW